MLQPRYGLPSLGSSLAVAIHRQIVNVERGRGSWRLRRGFLLALRGSLAVARAEPRTDLHAPGPVAQRLERLQILGQVVGLFLGQDQFELGVVVVDDFREGRKTPVMVEAALHVGPQSSQRRRAVAFVG